MRLNEAQARRLAARLRREERPNSTKRYTVVPIHDLNSESEMNITPREFGVLMSQYEPELKQDVELLLTPTPDFDDLRTENIVPIAVSVEAYAHLTKFANEREVSVLDLLVRAIKLLIFWLVLMKEGGRIILETSDGTQRELTWDDDEESEPEVER